MPDWIIRFLGCSCGAWSYSLQDYARLAAGGEGYQCWDVWGGGAFLNHGWRNNPRAVQRLLQGSKSFRRISDTLSDALNYLVISEFPFLPPSEKVLPHFVWLEPGERTGKQISEKGVGFGK